MDYKKSDAPVTTITRDIEEVSQNTGNIYEALAVVSKRADQISVSIREELTAKLEEFATHTDNLEEIFENREQIEISKFYERIPKPTAIAMEEYLEGGVYYRNPERSAY